VKITYLNKKKGKNNLKGVILCQKLTLLLPQITPFLVDEEEDKLRFYEKRRGPL
jgi:hypothetical protein